MYNDIFNGLTNFEEVELIISNTNVNETNKTLSYSIVINGDSVVSNIDICKKITAIMEVIKELFTKHGINIKYNIISSKSFEEAIINTKNVFINKFLKSEIIYSKDDYYKEQIQNINNKHKRA